jgi:hypothetical protein
VTPNNKSVFIVMMHAHYGRGWDERVSSSQSFTDSACAVATPGASEESCNKTLRPASETLLLLITRRLQYSWFHPIARRSEGAVLNLTDSTNHLNKWEEYDFKGRKP